LNHRELNLSTEESIEQIAQYFAQISQEYPLLDPDSLPQRVQDYLNLSDLSDVPNLSEENVSVQIKKSKNIQNQGSLVTSQKRSMKSIMLN
jgi:hypothetical protein